MAGPNTETICGVLEDLKLTRAETDGKPGAGVPFDVTDEAIAFLQSVKEGGKKLVVTDGGAVVAE